MFCVWCYDSISYLELTDSLEIEPFWPCSPLAMGGTAVPAAIRIPRPDNMFLPIDHKIELWPPINLFTINWNMKFASDIDSRGINWSRSIHPRIITRSNIDQQIPTWKGQCKIIRKLLKPQPRSGGFPRPKATRRCHMMSYWDVPTWHLQTGCFESDTPM